MQKVFIYDPTSSDKLSSVRGIGRYLQILKENFANEFEFVNNETMKQLNNDCVFINPFLNFLQPPLTLKRIARKQIAVIHDLIPLKYPSHFPPGIKGSIYILLNKLVLKNYDLIITDSEASKADIINILHIREDKIKVIYPCLPDSFINPKSEIRNPKQFLNFQNSNFEFVSSFDIRASNFCVYVGDATWNKNLVNLAKAIKIADVNCVFVGKVFENLTVDDRRLKVGVEDRKSKIEKNQSSTFNHQPLSSIIHPLSSNLHHPWQNELNEFNEITKNDKRFIFPGFVPDSELIKLYEQASFNILPSRDEGFGFSYLEAANFGCPSLLSDIPVLREISDGKAIFFDQKDPQNIANKIKEINSDKNLRNKIGADAKKRSQYFSGKKFREEIRSVLVCEST
ncbi:hypothetical protein COT02_01555 [Candidatus Roizmanbacteria bacterium CG07_land_8_20_14_0_80_34_15]|uniref:Glycosyl transferase family 1 domain-containing protein n=1 Tax=Candidatus Roizmanbacteria bacterium CG07_land_8_20_14_0_80_34_15 TaxID=1974849 RepID=A0A2M6YUX9_9BACT|nr:MAG: hypothetical protein COT02_01555 [Candidatus Roizmanbacteria bacterium CG07_land_8_20_14_0_80_34_15]